MSSTTFVRQHGKASDVIVEPASVKQVQPSIRTTRTPMEQQDSASLAHVRVMLLYTQILYTGMLSLILVLL